MGTGSRATQASHLATEHGELEASALGESGSLLGSGSLVGVEDSTELATGTLGLGVTDVGSRDDTANLLVHTAVDADLVGLIMGNLAGHNGDLTLDASLRLLDGGGEGRDLHSHLLASEAHSSSGLVANSTDVLHRLGEANIGESSTLGDLVVEEADRGCELGVEGLAVLGHALVELAEAVVRLLLGALEGTTNLVQGAGVATDRGSISGSKGGLRRAASSSNASLQSGDIGLHLGRHSTGVAGHLGGVAGELVVSLLQALSSLSLEGEKSTILGGNSVADSEGSTTLLTVDLPVEAGTSGSGLAVVAGENSVQGSEAAVGPLHRLLQVLLGGLGSSTDSVEDLLLELGASSLVLHVQSVDGAGGRLAQGRNHGGDLGRELGPVLLVDVLHLLLDSDGTLLTLLDGNTDSMADVTLVSLLHGLQHSTALGRLDSVGGHDTSELVDATLLLLGRVDSDGVHLGQTTSEGGLGRAKGIHGVKLGAVGVGHLLAVGTTLHLGVLGKGGVQLVGGTTKVVGRVATVLGHLVADLVHVHGERIGHALHLAKSFSLVLGHKSTELLVLLDVLVVTLVAELHHAHKLSMGVAVHLGLLELVTGNSVLESGDTGVELGSLATGSGGSPHEANLELSAGSVHASSGLLLGIGDILDGLREALVLEGLLGAEGSIHTGGGSLEHHVGVVAVLGHASTNLAELGRSGRSDGTDLVVREVAEGLVLGSSLGSELGATLLGLLLHVGHLVVKASHGLLEVLAGLLSILTDLGSIGSDVAVGLLDLGVGGRSESGKSTLLVEHGNLEAASSGTLVLTHDLTSLARATDGGAVALVSELSLSSKLGLDTTHVAVQGSLSTTSIHRHLGEKLLLHGGASRLVVGEVASHVGADSGDVSTTASRLLGNLLLDLVEVLEKAHAAIWRVRHDHT